MKQNQLAISGGARFYIKRFYVSGAVGWSTLDYTLRGEDSGTTKSGNESRFYHCYGVGYQLSLGDGQLEPFFNGTTGGIPRVKGTPKITLGARYAFRLH